MQNPWLSSCIRPAVLRVSSMQRFGPPDQEYYYKKSDDSQPDDPELSQEAQSGDVKGNALFL